MRQALIDWQCPLKLLTADESAVDRDTWRVHVVIGQLDGWRNLATDTAHVVWRDAARAVRRIIASVSQESDTIYAVGLCEADRLADHIRNWPLGSYWVSPPHPAIPVGTPEHDVVALNESGKPLPEWVPGDVYKRISGRLFVDEEWWPCTALLSFPSGSVRYREHLEKALQDGDYDLARRLVMVSPDVSGFPEKLGVSDFGSNPEMLNAAKLYAMAGGYAECVIGVNFYSLSLMLDDFLAHALEILTADGYDCYRSKGLRTFRKWAAEGRLPANLQPLTHDL